jgi:hypothetical protein
MYEIGRRNLIAPIFLGCRIGRNNGEHIAGLVERTTSALDERTKCSVVFVSAESTHTELGQITLTSVE